MAMLAIPLSPDISRLFRETDIMEGKRDPSDHITLFYFGDDLPLKNILKIIPVVFDVTSNMKPFSASCGKIISFPKGKYGYPVVGEIKSNDLSDFRNNLKKEFDKNKIKYDNTFTDYKPHVTIGYSEKEVKNIKFDKTNWSINQVSLYGGDRADSRLFINFPFTLGIDNKTARLNYFSNIFLKYVQNA